LLLHLPDAEDTLVRRRVLYANDEPTQIADSYYPWSIVDGCEALLHPDAGQGGSYSWLADLGYRPARFTEDVNVRVPDDAAQRLLEIEATLLRVRDLAPCRDPHCQDGTSP
jgi:GntR family transcriptional regulator